ncbi:Ribonuclease H domain [Macleaya cordata]|uniref:Ribonuclease H domain n=1 Tax=Macleaya cordata TaxID=56857 RepID=A0A200PZZ4_MACCD|nr:Ribonuclease H domain [Macleaya cordata]
MDEVWRWIHDIFNFRRGYCLSDVINCARSQSNAVKQAWNVASVSSMVEVWLRAYLNGIDPSISTIKIKFLERVRSSAVRINGRMFNTVHDLLLLNNLGVGTRSVKYRRVKDCHWIPPSFRFIKISCDGASRGNPGPAGAGTIFRNHLSEVVGTISQGLGICNNYIAEIVVIIVGLEWAATNCHQRGQWNAIKSSFSDIVFSSVYREVNFAADSLAKRGSLLAQGVTIYSDRRPENLEIEAQDKTYYRFV